ncbi:MAG TPA: hypothetical protein VNQ48_08175 [Microbacteriaceae bacterium]|nr:hypothetical protein [Microbacteriaceae bacterium]
MKAAPGDQELLLDLQHLDTRHAQATRREAQPAEAEAAAAARAERDRVRADAGTLRDALEDDELELRRVESDVELITQRLAHDEERMLRATDAKQATAFEHEVASLRRRRADLEEVQLIVMERVEAHEAAVRAVEADLAARERAVAEAEQAVATAVAAHGAERVEIEQERAELVGRLPADLVALYEKQRARYGFGASRLRRGVSEASGVALLADELHTVRSAAPDDVLICPSSNAILVRTAESGL